MFASLSTFRSLICRVHGLIIVAQEPCFFFIKLASHREHLIENTNKYLLPIITTVDASHQ
jgi:hypothetical protein